MRARVLLALALFAAAARDGLGQTTTADGVAALARGDYARAVEILKPRAEQGQPPDPAAQFFLAGLYEAGQGVAADPLRACALYARASIRDDHPLGRLASSLFAASLGLGAEFHQDCQLLASVGFDHGFEPATFHLGPGHLVEWTLGAVSVTYQGRTKRETSLYAQPGARFLPLEYTPLATGPTRSAKRHFVEVFVWLPSGGAGGWSLHWNLFEIAGDAIVSIETPQPLLTAEGDAPPSRYAFDVRAHAVVRMDAEGHAEWAVLSGPKAGSERIGVAR